MSYAKRLKEALDKLPERLALAVSQDVDKRINDWLAVEGHKEDDPYILKQVQFAERVVNAYEKEVGV